MNEWNKLRDHLKIGRPHEPLNSDLLKPSLFSCGLKKYVISRALNLTGGNTYPNLTKDLNCVKKTLLIKLANVPFNENFLSYWPIYNLFFRLENFKDIKRCIMSLHVLITTSPLPGLFWSHPRLHFVLNYFYLYH